MGSARLICASEPILPLPRCQEQPLALYLCSREAITTSTTVFASLLRHSGEQQLQGQTEHWRVVEWMGNLHHSLHCPAVMCRMSQAPFAPALFRLSLEILLS